MLGLGGNGGPANPISGASFAGQTSDANGDVAFTAPSTPGCYQYKAERSSAIRSPALYLAVMEIFLATHTNESYVKAISRTQKPYIDIIPTE